MSTTEFKTIRPERLADNTFRLFDHDWTLITAGTRKSFNMMTASWGGLGIIWNKPVTFIFVRPTRYTYEFLEQSERFTLSFFIERYRNRLNLCGSKSGREIDKVAATGLTPVFNRGAIYFAEARLVLVCRKIYYQDLQPQQILDRRVLKFYPKRDFHRMYFGEIKQVLIRA